MHAKLTLTLLPLLALSSPVRRQQNLQSFTGALGGVAATPVVDSGNADRPFQVRQDTFVNIAAALQRSCDQQFNGCANLANGGGQTFTVAECQTQKDQCSAADARDGAVAAGGNAGNAQNNAANNNATGNAAAACNAKKVR